MKLHYRQSLKPLARDLRRAGIFSEAILWSEIKSDKLGVRFLRQRPIGKYIVDFYCHALELVIEIDGAATHDSRVIEDAKRQKDIENLGITVLRFKDSDVKFNLAGVVEGIRLEILRLAKGEPPPLRKEERYPLK